jgi:predicted O-methyltransferase YrrM
MSLNDYLRSHSINPAEIEGHTGQVDQQSEVLRKLVQGPNIRQVMEIGFNAGHSAESFLAANPNIQLTSFDVGSHGYMLIGKSYIDLTYPFRHRLIIGNSCETLPAFVRSFPTTKFDLIFIDGSHDYSVALCDLINCRSLAHTDTIVVLDDTVWCSQWIRSWTSGPTRVWDDGLRMALVTELQRHQFRVGRGMACGRYLGLD